MSGFSYPEWIGDFYPPGMKQKGMLAYYSTRFGAVEINMTFRRDAEESTVTRWRDAVGAGFRFSLKAHQRITHWRRLVNAGEALTDFIQRSKPLGERLGPILFQVPATLKFDAGVLDAFCASLPIGGLYAFEPRNETFTGEAVGDVLRRHGVARCLNDDLFDPSTYRVTGPIAYFRFHRDFYSPDDLYARASLLRTIAETGTDVYVFFSHEDNPESVRPALRVQELLESL
jgi:uncharacterized protein YecE (DUF72 family)